MPILLILLIATLVAQIGFWDTLGAVIGAVGVIFLFVLIVAAIAAVAGYLVVRRLRRGSPGV
ncbi:MAG TPA: hypothetical protein VMP03_03555 [Methylomirabilota bacterium]|nr:hypothetical protein [Methylomirabilota bacterium]